MMELMHIWVCQETDRLDKNSSKDIIHYTASQIYNIYHETFHNLLNSTTINSAGNTLLNHKTVFKQKIMKDSSGIKSCTNERATYLFSLSDNTFDSISFMCFLFITFWFLKFLKLLTFDFLTQHIWMWPWYNSLSETYFT